MFVYEYFPVLEDPNHTRKDQPQMLITITDLNGKLLDKKCGYYAIYAGPEASQKGYVLLDGTQYKPWTTEAINLSAFRGQRIRINMTVYDCAQGGHFGYAYLSAYTGALNVKVKYCKGDEFATLIAPEGFAKYKWFIGNSIGNKLEVSKSEMAYEYTCHLTSVNGCSITLPAKIDTLELFMVPKMITSQISCNGKNDGVVDLRIKGGYSPYTFKYKKQREKADSLFIKNQ